MADGADPAAAASRSFVNALESFQWSDSPDPVAAARGRASAWATATLMAELATNNGGGVLTAQRVAAHETDAVDVVSITQQDPSSAGTKTELALVIVTPSAGAPVGQRTVYLTLTVGQQPNGSWLVEQVTE